MTEKKNAAKSEGEKDAGVEVPEPADADHRIDASGDGPMTDFDKHTAGVEKAEPPQPSEDEPHGHPFQPDAEPILVTDGAGRGQMLKSQRKGDELVKISPEEAYDDPEFNPVAAADTPGHKGGPQAEGGSERQVGVVDSGVDENAEALDYDWKGTNPSEKDKA